MLSAQGKRCAICQRRFIMRGVQKMAPHVDHCHSTNRVRGLLCGDCNTALGLLRDSLPSLRRAYTYLESV